MITNKIFTDIPVGDLTDLIRSAVKIELEKIQPPLQIVKEDPEELLTKQQAGKLLQVSHVTLNKLIREGKVPCFSIGNTIRFKRSEILKSLVPIRNIKYSRSIAKF